jgi:N-acetylated-alpha-linked acidic dipeptidase
MRRSTGWALSYFALSFVSLAQFSLAQTGPSHVFGYSDFSQQGKWDKAFMAIPDAKLAGEELKVLTAEPHWASSPEDYKTALYVAEKFKAAGLHTEIQEFRVWINKPVKIEIEAFDATGKKLMSGLTAATLFRTTRASCPRSTVRLHPAM